MIKTYQEKESEVDTSIQMNEGEELGMGRVERSLNCPITRQLMEDPVKCKKCGHTYTKKGKIVCCFPLVRQTIKIVSRHSNEAVIRCFYQISG